MGIRQIEVGFPKGTKSYATIERCNTAVTSIGAKIDGMCNARIVPIEDEPGVDGTSVRYTAIFFGFTSMQDAVAVSNLGFCCSN